MAAEAGSPIMQLYRDSSSLFSALVVERSWRGGEVVGKWGACRGYSVLPTRGKGDVFFLRNCKAIGVPLTETIKKPSLLKMK